MVGDMVPDGVWDGWEAALVALADDRDFANPKKGTGAAFAIGVTRDQVIAAHAELLDSCARFATNVDADLAALLHEEMRDCLQRYEARKQEAGALDFLDLLIKARDLVRDNQESAAGSAIDSATSSSTSFRIPIRCNRICCAASPGVMTASSVPARCSSSAIRNSRFTVSGAPTSARIAALPMVWAGAARSR